MRLCIPGMVALWLGVAGGELPGAARVCVSCHPAQGVPHAETSMAHALERAAESEILKSHAALSWQSAGYTYRIERQGERSLYSVTDGKQTISEPLAWAFGLGFAGQTYVYERAGELYQTRVSFYREKDGLDWTLGATTAHPANLEDAAGQLMNQEEKAACFGCHATNAVVEKRFSAATLVPGVQCERCHGPSEQHVKAMQRGDAGAGKMERLGAYSSEQISNFCGQCHRTWEQIAMSGIHGVSNVRFQPYRLTSSRCYDADDARIRCVSCHDPHREINRTDVSYDAKCLACHASRGAASATHTGVKAKSKMCPVATSNCASCHMPKIEIPGAHHAFTDHEIRVVKPHEVYPD